MAKKTARGLLVRDELIEILELTLVKGGYEVSAYAWSKLTEGMVKGGRVMDPKGLGREIKKLILASGTKLINGPVVLGLPQSQVFIKVFNLPKFEDKELDEAISWHVGSLSAMLPRDGYSSYEIVGKDLKNNVRVLLASVSQLVVDGYLEALEEAQVKVDSIEPLAISRARLVDPRMFINKSVASAHLYRGRLAMSILVNGKLWFSKESVVVNGKGEVFKKEVLELIRFFSEKKEKDIPLVTEIVYSGDKVGMEILERNLKTTKLKLIKADQGMVIRKSKAISDVGLIVFAPVLGLAMRGELMQKGLINLLPLWPKKKEELNKLVGLMNRSVVGVGLVVWLVLGLLVAGRWWLKTRIETLSVRINKLEQELLARQENEVFLWGDEFNKVVEVSSLIERSRLSFYEVLNHLSELVPKTVKVTSFSYNSLVDKWSMSGVAETREDVLVLDSKLKESEIFSEARLYFSSLENDDGIVFRFSGGKR